MADDSSFSVNNFGGVGLLEMRSARFAPDGTLAVGVHHDDHGTRYFSTWQATPWLETTLGYSDDKQDSFGVDRSLDVKIRLLTEGNYRPQLAIGIQDALGSGRYAAEYIVASKRYYDFDFTMGLAWGYLGSRGGIGNISRLFGDRFDQRSSAKSSGGIRSGSYFAGQEMAFFAGAAYYPPIRGLSFKLEYSGVDTRKIADFSHLKQKSAFNVGVNYKVTSWADVAVGFDRGDQFSIRLTLKQNLHSVRLKKWFKDTEPAPIFERPRSETPGEILPKTAPPMTRNDRTFDRLRRLGVTVMGMEQEQEVTIFKVQARGASDPDHMALLGAILESHDVVTLYVSDEKSQTQKYEATKSDITGQAALEKFRKSAVYARERAEGASDSAFDRKTARSAYDAMAKAGFSPISISFDQQKAVLKKEAGPSFTEVKNIGRAARILTREMPDSVEEFTIVSETGGLEVSRVSLLRRDLEKANSYQGSPEEIWANTKVVAPGRETGQAADLTYQPPRNLKFNWGFKPELLTHFGGNDDGRFRMDLYAKIFGSVKVTRNLKISGELKQYIVGDIDQIPQDMRPGQPKVRSDIGRYAAEGRTALARMQLDYTTQIAEDTYTRLTGGLLESMYGGLGAEILYRPYNRNFAVGVDLNWVKQRDFDQLFSFRDYDVLMGHATFYSENTNYNITSKLSIGRYLAGDFGATFDVSRRFSNGIRIGAWATITDMSSADFGDGSFDKGIYLTMPLEIFWYKPTRDKMRFNFRSLGKNGGQMLDRDYRLYDMLSSGRRNRLVREWWKILD